MRGIEVCELLRAIKKVGVSFFKLEAFSGLND